MIALVVVACMFMAAAVALFVLLVLERIKYFNTGSRSHVFNQMLYLLGCVIALMLGVGLFGFGMAGVPEKEET